jgi:hypothetical protein
VGRVTGRYGPVPDEWVAGGAPPGALAAFSEGTCPVHLTGLEPGFVGVFRRPYPAGWCGTCGCWWHAGPDGFVPAGHLVATWDTTGGGKDAAAGDLGE